MRYLTSGLVFLIIGCSPVFRENSSDTAAITDRQDVRQSDSAIMQLDTSKPRPEVTFQFADQAPARAIFDTGASGSAITKSFADRAGLPEEQPVLIGSGAGGKLI